MAGQRVDAQQAKVIGLVHDVFPDEDFLPGVRSFARHLVGLPKESVATAKLVVDLAADVDRTTQRHLDRLANTPLAASDDFVTRTARFADLRPKPQD